MTPLRWLGVLLGVVLLTIAIDRRSRLFRGDLVILGGLAIAVIVASATGLAGGLLAQFGFERGDSRQILGVVVFAVFTLLLLIALALSRIASVARDLDAVVEGAAYDEARRQGWLERFEDRIAIVIPAFNEEDNLGPVLDSIPERVGGKETEVLVVDDGSRDSTQAVARSRDVPCVRHVINRGQGAAMRTGYRIVADTDAAVVVAMDSDGQHQAEEMERLVAPILSGTVDLTNGSRTLGEGVSVHPMRDFGIVFFNGLISLLTRTKVTDCSNGYRAMRPWILPQIILRQNQFHNSEFLIEAIKRGVPTQEVPVTVTHRLSGKSKKPAVLRYGFGFTNAIFRTWLR
ncbi:MAG: glycosyltransferase family 2 protein [Nocardioidaceae bacterium]